MRTAIVVALLALAGCDGPRLRVEIHSAQPWAQGQEDAALAIAENAARWWQGEPEELGGWTLYVVDGAVDCGATDLAIVLGCVDPDRWAITVSTALGPCMEAAPIPHEVGHVLLRVHSRPDPNHGDPRWQEPMGFGPWACR